uniref:Immediate-early transcriptional regulatory protein-1 n=1 Tax=Dendrolimus kikuchii nucleopolyhedrovirus TaxID=1219875 RepID=V9LSR0_9ABAC|nr:immediate-early transcriptional regulatory protein-1 [Dendrolimus kikuchii nucleopolyhedrovirus]
MDLNMYKSSSTPVRKAYENSFENLNLNLYKDNNISGGDDDDDDDVVINNTNIPDDYYFDNVLENVESVYNNDTEKSLPMPSAAAADELMVAINSITKSEMDNLDGLLKTTKNLNNAVKDELLYALQENSKEMAESFSPPPPPPPAPAPAVLPSPPLASTSFKRKHESGEITGQFTKNKIRPKYKKTMIQSCVTTEEAIHQQVEITTTASTLDISNYFTNDFVPYLMQFENKEMHCNRFSEHMSENGYYMFVVKKTTSSSSSSSSQPPFNIMFAKYVTNVTYEYTNNYSGIDKLVFVVTFDKVRFMISHKLVKECGIEIPFSQNFEDKDIQNPNQCLFQEAHHNFKAALTSYFNLDLYYAQTKFVTVLQSMGESKTGLLLTKLFYMYKDRSLFTLPVMLSRKESDVDNSTSSQSGGSGNFVISHYVSQIIKFSENLQYPKNDYNEIVMNRLDEIVSKKSTLTYKYSSVANLLFNNYKYSDNGVSGSNSNCDNLKKIKKEDGSLHIVEQYLSQNSNDAQSNNFIVLTFKHDERLTIAKKAQEYFWVFGEIKDADVNQIIHKFNKCIHHTFVIAKVNRRDSTTIHNNLLKLLALILQTLVPIANAVAFAERKLNCKYKLIKF